MRIFDLASGRVNRIVLNAMRCIALWNHGQHTTNASEIIWFACIVLQYTLRGPALESAVPGGPPGVRCLIGVDKVVLDVLVHNTVQNTALMQYTQRTAWKHAKDNATCILQRLVEANRLSIDHNLPAVLVQLAIGGDNVGLKVMMSYCTNVARQEEFLACGAPLWDWITRMMAQDFVAAPTAEARNVLENFLGFLAALCRSNRAIHGEMMRRQIPERLCLVLGILQNLLNNDEPRDRLRVMKVRIIVMLGVLMACPMANDRLQHLKHLYSDSLLQYLVEFMSTPLQVTTCAVTAGHCMCILSHLMQTYDAAYSLVLSSLFKNVVLWMDSDPNNTTLMAHAMSLLCAMRLDTRNNVLNVAIIHAFSCLYKFASDATILDVCIRFLHRVSCDTLESKNVLRTTMGLQVELFMSPPAPPDTLNTAESTPTRIRPTDLLLRLLRSDMPHDAGCHMHLIREIIANIA
jgi:hypothetical protein